MHFAHFLLLCVSYLFHGVLFFESILFMTRKHTFSHFTQQNLQTLQAPTATRIAALNTLGSYCAYAPTLARQWGSGFLAIAEDADASPELRATAVGVWGRLGPQVYNNKEENIGKGSYFYLQIYWLRFHYCRSQTKSFAFVLSFVHLRLPHVKMATPKIIKMEIL